MIRTDLYINGGNFWGILAFFGFIALFGAITLVVNEFYGSAVAVFLVSVAMIISGIWLGLSTHDQEYADVVSQLHSQGFKDPIDINDQTFISGDRWCALKPIGDSTTIFKIVCEEEK